ncbi:MAG: acetylpolyamine amidohydrolase [Chloroflexota bacterium]|nr:MAG: acetylpolyamine amidohydrolase [Chloroflexota bacterium]
MLKRGRIPVFYTDMHRLHATDQAHLEGYPLAVDEVPARAEIILQALEAAQLGEITAPVDQGLEPILAVHPADFLEFLQSAYAESARQPKGSRLFPDTFATRHTGSKPRTFPGLKGYYAFDPYSPILAGTWDAAYWSAQCALAATAAVRAGEQVAYALCRPPGHHAAADLYGGYCYLNNAAIAARFLHNNTVSSGQRTAIAILDIDYHHGNGTQVIFYNDPSVLFCSLHADPDHEYPYYWGRADERGEGAGAGCNQNWPLPPGVDDATYLAALGEAVAAIRAFAPQYLLVSAGFDIFADDPVGGFSLTTAGIHQIALQIAALDMPTVIIQEGGYLQEHLGENAVAFLQTFL